MRGTDWTTFLEDNQVYINEYNLYWHKQNVHNFVDAHIIDKGVQQSKNKVVVDRRNKSYVYRLLREYTNNNDNVCTMCNTNKATTHKPNTYHSTILSNPNDISKYAIPVCKSCLTSFNHKSRTGKWFIGDLHTAVMWWRASTGNHIPNWAISTILGYSEAVIDTIKHTSPLPHKRKRRSKERIEKSHSLDTDDKQRVAQLSMQKGITPRNVLKQAIIMYEAHGDVTKLLASAGITSDGLVMPQHISKVNGLDGIYYDSTDYVYVRYDVESQTFVDDILVTKVQELLGENYANFWREL